jgi:ABC-type glycerol-3-phosphate transport system substrate-binding protein
MKRLLVLVLALVSTLVLAGCNNADAYDGLDNEVSGQIDLLLWSGSGTYWEDLGNQNLTEEDLFAQNDAAAYYVAKEFNKEYPNVKVNVLALGGGPTDGGRIWAQELDNSKNTYGAHPSVWATVDLPGDISKGIVADLSRFENDPLYQSMNPSIMQMMNYYGFQGGLPQYILPWGIYVNKELAEDQNLDVPDPDWTIEDYTDFIGNSEEDVYYGSMDTPIHLIETGTNDLHKSLFNYSGGDEFVALNSEEIRELIPLIEEWNEHSVWGSNPSQEFMDAGWWWSFKFFIENKLLTLEGDPWMMGDAATPIDPENPWWGSAKSSDWDIYPRPSTDYVDNTVGIVLDPMSVYNFCLEDGDLACTEEEELQIKISYTFASFWIADSTSWQVRADGLFTDEANNVTSSALNDSLPVTTGDKFEEQMNIWYTPEKHLRFKDETLMPGFHKVLEIYEAGQFWDVSDKAYPYFYSEAGTRRTNLYEWKEYWNPEINGGVEKGDANFTDTILGNLSTWNELANERFAVSYGELETGLKTYYGYKDEDFE